MATRGSTSRPSPKPRLWALGALLFQVIPPLVLWGLSRLTYGSERLAVSTDDWLTLVALGLCAACSGGLAWKATLELYAAPPPLRLLWQLLCLPGFLGCAAYTIALLTFLTWI